MQNESSGGQVIPERERAWIFGLLIAPSAVANACTRSYPHRERAGACYILTAPVSPIDKRMAAIRWERDQRESSPAISIHGLQAAAHALG
jgi:hypothetical protein